MRVLVAVILALAVAFTAGEKLLFPGLAPISLPASFPTGDRAVDVYASSAWDSFLISTNNQFHQLNYARTSLLVTYNNGIGTIDTTLADNYGVVFAYDAGSILRFNVTNITNPDVLNIPTWGAKPNNCQTFRGAINPNNAIGYFVCSEVPEFAIIDMLTFNILNYANYTAITDTLIFYGGEPGGAGSVVLDHDRNRLFLATNDPAPTQGQLWRFDISNATGPVFEKHAFTSASARWSGGFVDAYTGRLWLVEGSSGLVFGFDPDFFTFGSLWTVVTTSRITSVEYESALNQAYWIDREDQYNNNLKWGGGVYRQCVLDLYPNNIAEIENYTPGNTTYIYGGGGGGSGTFFEKSTRTLWIADGRTPNTAGMGTNSVPAIFTVYINATSECTQGYFSSASTLSMAPTTYLFSLALEFVFKLFL